VSSYGIIIEYPTKSKLGLILKINLPQSSLATKLHWKSKLLTTYVTGSYQNFNPHSGPFPDTHIIAHFVADTITYEEPTIPQ
jgi:hypothetical protein